MRLSRCRSDEAAAQNARRAASTVIKHTSLARRHAKFRLAEFDAYAGRRPKEARRPRLLRGAHFDEKRALLRSRLAKRAGADPIHVAQAGSARCAAFRAAPRSRGATPARCESRRAARRSAMPRPFRCPTVKLTMPACVAKNRAIGVHDLARLRALRAGACG